LHFILKNSKKILNFHFRDVDETLRLVQAFQYVDKHGEVCPAGWKPGKDTIDTNDKLKYFKKQPEKKSKKGEL
jgi:alkyl hydroperoxide reductase subunit AhpC